VTGGQFREVDLDLLADYVGGALTGTPDEAVVARLIVEAPTWGEAYAQLAPAVEALSGRLADWGADDLPMPDDITTRLATALADVAPVGPLDNASTPTGAVGEPPRPPESRRRLSAVPEKNGTPESRDRSMPPRRRRWSWVVPAAVAATVVAVVGVGVGQHVFDGILGDGTGTLSDSAAPAEVGAPRAATMPSPDRVLRSGTDYTRATLAGALASQRLTPPPTRTGEPTAVVPFTAPSAANQDPRTARRDELAACLDAVAERHRRGPIVVDLVDYAAFEGEPALVITFVDPAGERWAWIAGPSCGNAGSGADMRYRTRVG